MTSQYNPTSVRKLVDKFFSLQWCRDNLVVPLYEETSLLKKEGIIKIAIANYSYLGTIANPIEERLSQAGFTCEFIKRSQEEIQEILNLASEDRFINGGYEETSQFDENSVLEAVKETSDQNDDDNEFVFEFDDDIELDIEEEILDLAIEMMESKIQKAAGMILINCQKNDVSDIHIEPKEDSYKIRVRRDGVMQKFMSMSKKPGIQLVACLKNMACMDIAERRASQDGKILRKFDGNKMEFRCSTIPGMFGESMVLRILNSDSSTLSLDTLINIDDVREDFRRLVNEKDGLIIFSGPTGSGKSTTLAASLREIDNGELKIVTAEDPIEYELGGDILQTQVNRAKGQTFVQLVRTFLRQDPDVILVGETRDPETADASLDAAEVGHLVITTLHANTASSSLTRLLEMDVPKYKLNTFVKGVLNQRLARRVCNKCSTSREVTQEESKQFDLQKGTLIRFASSLTAQEKKKKQKENTLCTQCLGTGYKGRVGVYEFLVLDKKIKKAITEGNSEEQIEQIAINENNMLSLKQYGLELVKDHLTTLSEVMRVCIN